MSIKPWEKYQPNAQIPTPQYPWGSLKNESNLGVGDGTPLDVDWGNDFEAFKQTSFDRSGLVPSGVADTVEDSEMFDAMQDTTTREMWRRILSELGYNLVSGSFEDVASPTNIGLTFKYLQPMQSTTPQSSVSGPGFVETLGVGKTAQLVKNSNNITGAAWSVSNNGGLTGVTYAFGKYGAGETSRYIYGTQINLTNAVADETQFYKIGQTLTGIAFSNHISLGVALRCVSGDVDIFVKLQGVTSGSVYSVEHRLVAGSKVVELWHSCPSVSGVAENYVFEIQLRPWVASVVHMYNTHVCASPNVRRAPASIGSITNFVQKVDEDSGINVRHSVAPATILTPPISLYQYDFDTYIMPDLTGNVTLAGDGYDGQRVTFKKRGGAAANILSPKQIDGLSSYPMTTANSAVTLMFSAELDTWLVISKV